MNHYFFRESISGEEFLVGADTEYSAIMIAEGIAEDIGYQRNDSDWRLECYGEVTEEEAEASGLDEY